MNPIPGKNIFASYFKDGAAEIVEAVNNNQHCAFEFDYGCGETEFSELLLKRLAEEPFLVFNIDLHMISGPEQLAKHISRASVAAFGGNMAKIEKAMAKLIPTATTKIVIGETEEPYIEFDYHTDTMKLLSNLFDFPEMAGTEENRRSVVLWKGFDNLKGILRGEGMRIFTGKVRGHAITSHVMTGRGIADTARKLGGSMANQVRVIDSSAIISREDILSYIRGEVASMNMQVSENVIDALYGYADGRLEAVKNICSALSHRTPSNGPVTMEAATKTISDMALNAGMAYRVLWNNLNARQKSALLGICRGDSEAVYSEKFIKKYGFGTATNLQAALRALKAKSILEKRASKWVFADPFFGIWIRLSSGHKIRPNE